MPVLNTPESSWRQSFEICEGCDSEGEINVQDLALHNSLNQEMMNVLGIQHRLTTTYHPQANGLDERYNQTLKKFIVKFIDGKSEEWDNFLPEIAYSYNTAVQEFMKSNTLLSTTDEIVVLECYVGVFISFYSALYNHQDTRR